MPNATTRKTGLGDATRRAADRPISTASDAGLAVSQPLMRLVAQATSLTDVLSHLHRRAVTSARGTTALLFERNTRSGALHATSGFALDEIPADPWIPSRSEEEILAGAFARNTPKLVAQVRRQLPELAERLLADGVLLVPLQQNGEPVGVLAIGVDSSITSIPSESLSDIADAFVTVLELFRLRENQALQRDLRVVLEDFAAVIGARLNLSDGLDAFCQGANRLFGADRTAVWIHDRRTHHLVCAASDPESTATGARVAVVDTTAPAALAMRRPHAEIHPTTDTAMTITVPLRGCRRALGTLVLEGVRLEPGREFAALDGADELGRQLAAAIENIQLLDDVVRSRHELENTFDSIAHLVAVWDRGGRIVHVNQAFARRVGLTRDELLDRPLDQFVGPELRAWLADQTPVSVAGHIESPVSFEVMDPILNGLFLITVTALRNHSGDQVGSVLVARDLTAQAKLLAEGEELRRRLLQSEKLAAVGQFVAGIAHELNNPLQGVLGHHELLRVSGVFPQNLRRAVQTI